MPTVVTTRPEGDENLLARRIESQGIRQRLEAPYAGLGLTILAQVDVKQKNLVVIGVTGMEHHAEKGL